MKRKLLRLFVIGGLAAAADQLTKVWAVASLRQTCEVVAREGPAAPTIETCDAHAFAVRLDGSAREVRFHRGPAAFFTLACDQKDECLRGVVGLDTSRPGATVTRLERDATQQALLMLRGVPIDADHLTTGADGQLYRAVAVRADGALSTLRFKYRAPAKGVDVVPGLARLRYVENPGAAWGLFGGLDDGVRTPLFAAISIVAIAFLAWVFARAPDDHKAFASALALILGGAVGNLLDRLRDGFVVDFIELHVQDKLRWPTFNFADVAISVGVVVLVYDGLRAWWRERKAKRSPPSSPDTPPPDAPTPDAPT